MTNYYVEFIETAHKLRWSPVQGTFVIGRQPRPGTKNVTREVFSGLLSERGDQSIISHRFPLDNNPAPREPALENITFGYKPYIVVVGGEENSSAFGLPATADKSRRAAQKCSQCNYCAGDTERMLRHLVLHRGSVQCPWNNVVGPEACSTRDCGNSEPKLFYRWDKLEEYLYPAALRDLPND